MSKEMNVLGREFLYWVRKKFDGLKTDKHIEEKALHHYRHITKNGAVQPVAANPSVSVFLLLRLNAEGSYIGSFSK